VLCNTATDGRYPDFVVFVPYLHILIVALGRLPVAFFRRLRRYCRKSAVAKGKVSILSLLSGIDLRSCCDSNSIVRGVYMCIKLQYVRRSLDI
jgi:hypothetical protein